jgi:hypothetical protein
MNIKRTIAGTTIILAAALGTGALAQNLAAAGRGASSEQFNVTELSYKPSPTAQPPIPLQHSTATP